MRLLEQTIDAIDPVESPDLLRRRVSRCGAADAETEYPLEQQRDGWQAILGNFEELTAFIDVRTDELIHLWTFPRFWTCIHAQIMGGTKKYAKNGFESIDHYREDTCR